MIMALGRCSGLFSEGVSSWDETGQCCHWHIIPIFPFETFGTCWFLYVSTILWLAHRDCRIFIVSAWWCACLHTLDLSLSSHLKEVSHQSQVIGRLIRTHKSLSLTVLECSLTCVHCVSGLAPAAVAYWVNLEAANLKSVRTFLQEPTSCLLYMLSITWSLVAQLSESTLKHLQNYVMIPYDLHKCIL
jgi:hypothetical protein